MTATQHTSGPWKTGKGNPSSKLVYTADGKRLIASCNTPEMMAHGDEEANARLLAAAPDLLEALEIVRIAFERGYYVVNDRGEEHERIIAHISSAITKARVEA